MCKSPLGLLKTLNPSAVRQAKERRLLKRQSRDTITQKAFSGIETFPKAFLMNRQIKKGALKRPLFSSLLNFLYFEEYSFCFLPECFKAAWAAAKRAMGTRYGEQET